MKTIPRPLAVTALVATAGCQESKSGDSGQSSASSTRSASTTASMSSRSA